MSRYECVRLLWLLLLLCVSLLAADMSRSPRPSSGEEGAGARALSSARSERAAAPSRLVCSPHAQHTTFTMRNACFDGFLTIVQGKPVAQHQGLDIHSPKVELVKETCRDWRAGLLDPVMTRLRHKRSGKYICFNRRGKLRAVTRHRAEKLGRLCAFYEMPVSRDSVVNAGGSGGAGSHVSHHVYVRLRSSFDRRWLLGFRGGRHGLGHTPDGHAVALPHHMHAARARAAQNHEDACDFLFATAEYSPSDWRLQWTGLLDRIAHPTQPLPLPQPQPQSKQQSKSQSQKQRSNNNHVRSYSTP